ncbi:hypothetical protein Oscil6304_0376 [Oscillatoria acuminata PCC 6304]|uniref:Uncharacterized protein n=1 Tax=Oscillatoria acuminata PCC 6304 TaxID=56110 RepID=K9TDB8_9CYAN|nr:hypothetical protein Oscil6304_0376 [Oscillatoria acuminata PCC 6304]
MLAPSGGPAHCAPTDTFFSVERLEDLYFAIPSVERLDGLYFAIPLGCRFLQIDQSGTAIGGDRTAQIRFSELRIRDLRTE